MTTGLNKRSGKAPADCKQEAGALRLLFLEDSRSDEELIRRELRKEDVNFVLNRVETKYAFTEELARFTPDIILADYLLPAYDGMSALEEVLRQRPDTPFIFVSGTMGEEFAINGLKKGATDYVLKQNLARLVPAIRRALAETAEKIGRKRAEAALRKSEQELKEAQRVAGLGYWMLEWSTGDITWSEEIPRIFGLEENALPPPYRDLERILTADSKARLDAAIEQTVQTGMPYDLDLELVHPDGSRKWINARGEINNGDDGPSKRLRGTVLDITGRKRSESALIQEKNKSSAILAALGDGLSIQGTDFKIIYQNPVIQNDRGAHVGEYCYRAYHNTDTVCEGCPLAVAFDDGKIHRAERSAETDRGRRYVDITVSPLKDDKGAIIAGIELVRDITSRKRMEKEFIESERRFKLLLESTTDSIYRVTVENGRPVKIVPGPGCLAVTGYASEEYEADPALWMRMIYGVDRQAVIEHMSMTAPGTGVLPFEHRIIHKDGSIRWVKNTPVPRYDDYSALITYDGLISDITERKRLEEQLLHAQKMEAIGQLAGGVAHDFNNILSAIVGYGYILQMKMEKNSPLRQYVSNLLQSADRASLLTSSLLAFSRKQLINPAQVNLNDIILRIEQLLRRVIGEDIELKTAFRENAITVHADSGQIGQVLMNLATNARDAMPKGGLLSIETDTVRMDDAFRKTHGYGKEGWYALVSVADTGTGMDETTRKRIFEPFFTTKDVGKGTGLGLSMAYGIVKQHKGYITVSSEPGSGTVFTIYLPLVKDGFEKSSVAAPPISREFPKGNETILLAEDDSDLREFLSGALEDFGYSVVVAEDGTAAVERFRENRGTIQLLILDVIMPGKNGNEVLGEIRKAQTNIKAIFLSGYSMDKITADGLLAEGAELLLKPVFPGVLLQKIREVLDRSEQAATAR